MVNNNCGTIRLPLPTWPYIGTEDLSNPSRCLPGSDASLRPRCQNSPRPNHLPPNLLASQLSTGKNCAAAWQGVENFATTTDDSPRTYPTSTQPSTRASRRENDVESAQSLLSIHPLHLGPFHPHWQTHTHIHTRTKWHSVSSTAQNTIQLEHLYSHSAHPPCQVTEEDAEEDEEDSAVAVEAVTEEVEVAAEVASAADEEAAVEVVDEEADSATAVAVAVVVAADEVLQVVEVAHAGAAVHEGVDEAAQQGEEQRVDPTSSSNLTVIQESSSPKVKNTSWSHATWSQENPSMAKRESASNHHQRKKEHHLKR